MKSSRSSGLSYLPVRPAMDDLELSHLRTSLLEPKAWWGSCHLCTLVDSSCLTALESKCLVFWFHWYPKVPLEFFCSKWKPSLRLAKTHHWCFQEWGFGEPSYMFSRQLGLRIVEKTSRTVSQYHKDVRDKCKWQTWKVEADWSWDACSQVCPLWILMFISTP